MTCRLADIVEMSSGIYRQLDPDGGLLYLQAVHFDEFGAFDTSTRPAINEQEIADRHRLSEGDILFAAKGNNNMAVVYHDSMGPAVASSSFIVLRVTRTHRPLLSPQYLAWYISHAKKLKLFHQQKLGSTIPSLSMKELATLEISIPPLERQETILRVQALRDREKILSRLLDSEREKLTYQLLLQAASTN